MIYQRLLLFLLIIFSGFMPSRSWACACGCGIFDVGTSAMLPSGSGGTLSLEYDFMNQNRNWSGTSKAPADDNDDKKIRTNFITAGFQYMFNRRWGLKIDLPYDYRYFKTTDENSGDLVSFTHAAVGDMRIRAIYTGFSADMSTGITFGLKEGLVVSRWFP